MLDVHAPHESMHGWRDFMLHLITITIGLLIALSLEGLVEWQHHRHLAHDAEASLHAEIKSNSAGMATVLDDIHKRQATIDHDISVLNYFIANGKYSGDHHTTVALRLINIDNLSWKTAQSTGALSYMPYDLARQYAGLYTEQDSLSATEQQAARDAVLCIGALSNEPLTGPPPSREHVQAILDKLEVLQGQLFLVESVDRQLAADYKQFLSTHPN